jgi:hypothetical protein
MIAANDQAALARGDVDIILGELHAATNTLEAQLFAAQHPDTARLRNSPPRAVSTGGSCSSHGSIPRSPPRGCPARTS